MIVDFKQYIKELQSIPIDEITEHSKRFALETILRELASGCAAANTNKINVLHEPKRKDNYGSPDFKIYSENSIIGYVENKKISENLDKILKSEQIKKYRELSQNLLITNYVEFVWIKGEMIQRETLCYLSDIENKKFKLDNEKAEKVENLLLNFFSQAPEKIALPKDLALALAVRCKNLKNFINDELNRQIEYDETERLFALYKAFKDNIFTELTISDFSDAYAQMLIFSFFLAGLNAEPQNITTENAKKYIPSSFQLIKELVAFLDELEKPEYRETKWIIDETISIVNNINWTTLKQNLSFNNRIKDKDNLETDPYIYFYENFLAIYDYELRKSKGVYYTPPQVVDFIVRSVNEVLKTVFNISVGFANRNLVTVLDFATGTGTFLVEIFKLIIDSVPKESKSKRDMLIKEHILQNIYGFEYLIAPYTIAHLKLSQFLRENGYEFQEKDRLQVFLTNTLEPIDKQIKLVFLPQLSRETQAAQKVKDKPILVITGNPPYSVISKNKGEWITNLIEDYKFVDGRHFGERKHSLQDDYVKFIRFAQEKMKRVEQGIIGIITNHSFLDNPTFRGMRQSLMTTFDYLYFIDLHGNAKKKERTPENEKDENVFDIEQGVAISILIKKKGLEKKIYHADFFGLRSEKYQKCLENTLKTIDFTPLIPEKPYYFFVPKTNDNKTIYETGIAIDKIFHLNSMGVCSARDSFVVDFSKEKLLQRISEFSNLKISDTEIKEKYKKLKDTRGWKLTESRKYFSTLKNQEQFVQKICFRIFDNRFIFYHKSIVDWDRWTVMQHLQKENLALNCVRIGRDINSNNYFITNNITDKSILSSLDNANIFPLYLYEKQGMYDKETEINEKHTNKELNEQQKIFEKIQKEYLKYKNKFEKITNPTNDDIEFFEEQKMSYEESLTLFENFKKHLIKSKRTKETENIKILENGLVKRPNFTNEFQNFLTNKYEIHFSPEQILGYIYAILHSNNYRAKYAEFLKIDYPKIPFTEDTKLFEKLSYLGSELIEKHDFTKIPTEDECKNLGNYKGEGNDIVLKTELKIEKIDNETKYKLYINKTQYFETVTEEIYNFQIGGYQVLDKYLKDRKNIKLDLNEVENIENIVKVISFTINQMKLIEKETKEWI